MSNTEPKSDTPDEDVPQIPNEYVKKSAVKTMLFGVARHPYERIDENDERPV